MILTFSVHATVQGKGRAKPNYRQRRVHTPAATVRYEKAVAAEATDVMSRKGIARFVGAVQMDIIIRLTPPTATSKAKRAVMLAGDLRPTRKPDLDNVAKAVGDALNGVAFADDVQIAVLHVERIYAPSEGLDVQIKPAERPAWMTPSTE